jgi:hypothetical protein
LANAEKKFAAAGLQEAPGLLEAALNLPALLLFLKFVCFQPED